ncbi:MAG: hypothetical protein CME62_13885 [Halobacteriovoraceae bacterium]|nr:hypothetical protein [Halobacteriovoraceae bacterium]|tara:strand:- start:10296 stop:10808 length:513 start_codon:yes stop_codon:yes gene_type:complete
MKKKNTQDQEVQGAQKNKQVKEIDVDQIDLERMKDRTTDLPALLEYAHSIGGFSVVPTEQGVIKGQAMTAMKEQTEMHMEQIYDQMKLLAEQAHKLKRRAEVSFEIYDAQMGFKPVIGNIYYLYEKKNKKILSIVSPQEWGKTMPFDQFLAKVKLLADHTWEVLEDPAGN